MVSISTSGLSRSSGRRRHNRSIGQWRRCAHSTCLTVHLHKKDFSDLSSVTVNKLHTPSLYVFVAERRLDEPARSGCVSRAFARDVRAHENPNAASALGRELQPPRFDLAQTFN